MSKKTALEHFQDIKELEVADGPEITVEDLLPYKCEQVEKALHRLESIDNAEPNEALEELIDMIEYFTRLDYVEPIVRNEIHDKFKDIYWHKLPHLDSIKKALIKAEKEHNSVNLLMQELDCNDFADLRKYARCGYEKLNEQYLKWEDLEFKEEEQIIKVLLNGEKYYLYVCSIHLPEMYVVLGTSNFEIVITKKQFFNDLHLEVAKE